MHISTTKRQTIVILMLTDRQTEVLNPYLNVRPGGLKSGFILLRVKIRVITWWESPEYVGADLEVEKQYSYPPNKLMK